jgi:ectoine hydroxylase-related dioxygenase (phytanoyl-CoA dioxygenase family)
MALRQEIAARAEQALAEDGFCVLEGVLDATRLADIRARLWAASAESQRRGVSTWIDTLDPNDRNIRVFGLLELDGVFRELIVHPVALAAVRGLIGNEFIISNFTANIALPGSGSMALHSDQSLVIPAPWLAPWALNVIWCLDDVHEANGATRYVPGSHRVQTRDELQADAAQHTRPFIAKAGSVIVMDGRLWHTSGRNETADEERALLFAYYTRDFIRPQVNWNVVLSPEVQAGLDPALHHWLGLGPGANTSIAAPIVSNIPRR